MRLQWSNFCQRWRTAPHPFAATRTAHQQCNCVRASPINLIVGVMQGGSFPLRKVPRPRRNGVTMVMAMAMAGNWKQKWRRMGCCPTVAGGRYLAQNMENRWVISVSNCRGKWDCSALQLKGWVQCWKPFYYLKFWCSFKTNCGNLVLQKLLFWNAF